jgi:hypothetical protein
MSALTVLAWVGVLGVIPLAWLFRRELRRGERAWKEREDALRDHPGV